jgi:excinuclease ABC subunit C
MPTDTTNTDKPQLQTGAYIIQGYVRQLPDTPGVYRMMSTKDGDVLYVGKAKSLKKRVVSYTHTDKLPVRLQRMVAATRHMEFVHTHTEVEALLLEANLIKKLKPRFNILLRDDKSFPYILLTGDHDFPQVTKYRGVKKRKGHYFGPYASAGLVNKTIIALQRAFMLRNCSDNVFNNRSRPCLQYHIKRCTAPCVNHVSADGYAQQVEDARQFLSGKSRAVQNRLVKDMQAASEEMEYEKAAVYRDRINALTSIQAHQDINVSGLKDADVLGLSQDKGKSCIQVFFFRGGQNMGNRSYFPRHMAETPKADILGAFMAQFYHNKPVPGEILVNGEVTDHEILEDALTQRRDAKVKISIPKRGQRARLMDFVLKNAVNALQRKLLSDDIDGKALEQLAEIFDLDEPPERIEIYDNSHISGTNMVGAMVVAGQEGFQKNAYRKFNIKTAAAADDVGMMREVMTRRFKAARPSAVNEAGEDSASPDVSWPDVVLIDGGQGQFNAVKDILDDYGLTEQIKIVSIAKGPDRNAGRETFYMEGRTPFDLPINHPALHYLQRLRDEAHRFAIGSHRARRQKQMTSSPLDEIAGIGGKRKKALLLHFGSAKAVADAGVSDLETVDGVSRAMAQNIYDHFNEA